MQLFNESLCGFMENISEQTSWRPTDTADKSEIRLRKSLNQGKVKNKNKKNKRNNTQSPEHITKDFLII